MLWLRDRVQGTVNSEQLNWLRLRLRAEPEIGLNAKSEMIVLQRTVIICKTGARKTK